MYYIAQKEYAKEEKLQDVFSFHRKYSTAFGGKPKAEYNNVKPIEENINKEFKKITFVSLSPIIIFTCILIPLGLVSYSAWYTCFYHAS